jgi:uncharacterized protein (DUF58 family)
VPAFRLFQKRADRATLLRQQAEDVFAQLRTVQASASLAGTPLRGQHSQRQGGPGHDFWQYRDFQSGDHSRTIDWKQSAKTDRLLIRQKEKETQKRTTIWLQNDASMNFSGSAHRQTKYECGAVVALVSAMLGAERHDPVSLSGVGAVTMDDLTHILAEGDFQCEVDDLSGHEVFLIGDFLDFDHTFDGIPPHKRVHLIQILDSVEIDLPFSGRTLFEHPSGADQEQILSVTDIRSAYQAKLQAHLDDLKHLCKSRNWSYTFIRSGEDLFEPLLDVVLHSEAV